MFTRQFETYDPKLRRCVPVGQMTPAEVKVNAEKSVVEQAVVGMAQGVAIGTVSSAFIMLLALIGFFGGLFYLAEVFNGNF